MNKSIYLTIALVVMLACAGDALALGPLGPPTAGLKQGQAATSFEYWYGDSELDIVSARETLHDVLSNAYLVQPRYGVTDNLETYVLLGVADTKMEGYSSNPEFAYGFGTKVTFYEEPDVSWGAMFEMGWRSSDDACTSFDYYDMVIAVGPTIHITPTFRIYGGPFIYLLRGKIDVDDTGVSPEEYPEDDYPYDYPEIYYSSESSVRGLSVQDLSADSYTVEQKSELCGYAGAEWDIDEATSFYAEVHVGGEMWGLGTGVTFKF